MLRNIGFHSHKRKTQLSGVIEKKINENKNIPLEEILSEDTVIDELQNHNQILINYLTKEKIKQMIDYIIKEPPDDTNYDKGHKFPWICSQLFNIENSEILRFLYMTNKELEEKDNKINNDNNNNNKDDNKIELLDYLLNFLTNEKEPNYVLCGYFASLIKTLLISKPTIIIKYFYNENKEFIKKLIDFSYRESISEILNKIFQYDITEEEYNNVEMDLIRMEILEGLFDKIDINMENEKLDSIATLIKNLSTEEDLFSDLLNNRKIINNLITKPLKNINLLIKDKNNENIIINRRRNFIIIIDIIINWINSINTLEIYLPSSSDETEDDTNNEEHAMNHNNNFNHTLLSYELFNILLNLIKINFNKNYDINNNESEILQCFDERKLIPLGLFRIKIVDLLGNLFSYFKNISTLYDTLLIDSEFFENAIDYLFQYEFNNIYQESLLFLFKQYLNYSQYHPSLSEFLFKKINIMNIIISKLKSVDNSEAKNKFWYMSGHSTSRGYISFLISLAYKINTVIGGEPLRINDTLSREGSMSFRTRATPYVAKEEITNFYGMEENELYEEVSNESDDKKNNKFHCAIKSMEKYLNDEWNEYFNEHISDKIKLYETKLLKEANRDSIFRNPFILEYNDEKIENRQNNFGLGDYENEGNRRKRANFGDEDMNMGNRFKMSMRLPRSMNTNNNIEIKGKRGSWGSIPKQNKVMVDEVDNDNNDNKEDDKKDIKEEKNNDNNNEEEEEDKDPFINFRNTREQKEENPLDIFSNKNEGDDDPFKSFKSNKSNERNISLVSFRKKKKEEKEEDNLYEDIENKDNNDKDINQEKEEENPLDKFNKQSILDSINNKDNDNNEKIDLNDENLYEDNDNGLDNENLYEDNDNNDNNDMDNENLYEDNKDEINDENNMENKIEDENLYEDVEDNENLLDKFKKENKIINEDKDNENPLDKFMKEKENKNDTKDNENPLDKFKKENKNENNINILDKFKNENNNKEKEEEFEIGEEEEEEEEENPLNKLEKENKNKEEEGNTLDKFKNENNNKEKDKNPIDILNKEKKEEENPLDKFKNESKKMEIEDKEKDKTDNLDDLLYETKEEDDEYEEEEEEEDSDAEKNKNSKRKEKNKDK